MVSLENENELLKKEKKNYVIQKVNMEKAMVDMGQKMSEYQVVINSKKEEM